MLSDVIDGNLDWPIVMMGKAGSGKTCAALCILDGVSRSRKYATCQRFVDDVRKADMGELMCGDYPEAIGSVWSRWREYGITCMDELGARDRVSDHHYDTVKRAIDERHGKPAIWISNLSLDQIERVYDDRIASRLAEGTHVIFSNQDRRLM